MYCLYCIILCNFVTSGERCQKTPCTTGRKSINNFIHISKRLITFLLPGGLVFFAAIMVIQKGYFTPWLPQINESLPYVVLGIGLLLGLGFHRSRLAFVVLILILADRTLHYFGPGGIYYFSPGGVAFSAYGKDIFQVTALLLPINMALFYFVRERGVLNLLALFRLLFILAQPLGVYYCLKENRELFQLLNLEMKNLPVFSSLDISPLALLVYGIILLAFLIGSLLFSRPILRGFFWSLLCSGVALYAVHNGPGSTIYFSVAGLIIILSVIQTAYAMAYNDELTGLPARRALNTTLQSLGRNYTIAMLDIDFFKKFNDKYGHDIGDQVLCMVASHIRQVGGGGKPFRYGGEEFTVVFPGKSKSEARPYLESLRVAIADAKFMLRGSNRPKKTPKKRARTNNAQTVSVTISIGAAEPARSLAKPDDVIKAADKALYRAKKKGRNCVVA